MSTQPPIRIRPLLLAVFEGSLPMIDYSEREGKLTFTVHVVPGAARTEIVGEHNGALRVRLAAAPVDGAANEALRRTLALGFRGFAQSGPDYRWPYFQA